MRLRILYLSCLAALEQLKQNSTPAQPARTHPLDDPKTVQRLLKDRYGPFDVVAGQRHPFENIP